MDNKKLIGGLVVVVVLLVLFSARGGSNAQSANLMDSIKGLFTTSSSVSTSGTTSTGNGAPSGAHYNLNIIGVAKNKTASLTDTSGHRIFVPLSGSCKINLVVGSFDVLDGNCTDGPATLQLPDPDPDGDGITAYSVYARALGQPGGKATATSCVQDLDGTYCSTEQVVLVRNSGKSTFSNFSKQLLSICMDTNGDGVCDTRQYLFDDSANNYFWQYDNNGLRVAQLRFYEVPTDVGLTP